MTQFSPTALEEAAKAIYETWARNRSIDETWFGVCHVQHSIANEARQEATAAITAYLAQREKEGFVEVPKEASEEIVNAALDKHAEITPCESPFGPDGYLHCCTAPCSPPHHRSRTMTETIDTAVACERIGAMWLRLAEQIADGVPDLVINDQPQAAIRWATYAEACFWKATGEGAPHDVKDVLPSPPAQEGR